MYGAPGSRTQIVEWLALEVGVELKSVMLNRAVMNSPEYRAVHPFGKIPGCKAEDGTGIFESGAIMLYVADVAGSLPTPEARGAAASWVVWANATMWPALEASGGKCNLENLFGPVVWPRGPATPMKNKHRHTPPHRHTTNNISYQYKYYEQQNAENSVRAIA